MNAYPLTAPLTALMQPGSLPKLPLAEAIRQHIDLLLATRQGEYRYDRHLGNAVWAGDYAAITNPTLWKGEAEQALTSLIQQYEKRVRHIQVAVAVDERDETDRDGTRRARKRLTVRVNGTLADTDDTLPELEFTLYINPLSSQ